MNRVLIHIVRIKKYTSGGNVVQVRVPSWRTEPFWINFEYLDGRVQRDTDKHITEDMRLFCTVDLHAEDKYGLDMQSFEIAKPSDDDGLV